MPCLQKLTYILIEILYLDVSYILTIYSEDRSFNETLHNGQVATEEQYKVRCQKAY